MSSIEIQVFAMHNDRIAQRGETIDFWDIVVSHEPDESGSIEMIDEVDQLEDLTLEQASKAVEILEAKYDVIAEWVGGDH